MQNVLTWLKAHEEVWLCVLVAVFCVAFMHNCQKEKIEKQTVTDTKETDLWKAKYQQTVTQLNKEIANHVNTTIVTYYAPTTPASTAPVIASVVSHTEDNSTINSQQTSTSTATVTTEGKTIERKTTVKVFDRTALFLGVDVDGAFKDITPNIALEVNTWMLDAGYGINRKEYKIGIKDAILIFY